MEKCGICGKEITEEEWVVNWTSCSDCFDKGYKEYLRMEERKGIPDFLDSLEKMRELHQRKNQDYASSDNAFSNFEFTEFVLGYFTSDRDKSYVWPIACKLARLGSLLSNDREPNNESIEDSLLDIANYTLLWKADIPRRVINLTVKPKSDDKGNQQ